MCGIAGFSGSFDPSLLKGMGSVMAYRGPDDRGEILLSHQEERVGFVHQRLSIIDLSPDGHQPMTVHCPRCNQEGIGGHDSEKLWVTFNGEIYNYKELRSALENQGHRFHSHSDTEVLLHLYAAYGIQMLQRLNGIFAFAIFDGRTKGQKEGLQRGDIFLARDGLGVKPLYYVETSLGFLFASEIKALLQCSAVQRELDHTALHYYLAYLWVPSPQTMFKNIYKLPPGHALVVRGKRMIRQWAFYDIPYEGSYFSENENDIVDLLREKLKVAVKRQMIADVPVGAFLSGGLDSSAVVAMMRQIRPEGKPICYCIGFDNDMDVEGNPADLPYARQVAKHLDVDLRIITVNSDMIQNLERMLYHLDEPQADPAPINALMIAEQAKRSGMKVLLSGAGGDDIFSGYRRHWALQFENLFTRLPQGVRRGIASYSKSAHYQKSSWIRRALKLFSHIDLSPEQRLIAYFYWSGDTMRRSLYSSSLADELKNVDTDEPLRRSLKRIPNEKNPLNRMLYLEAKHFLSDHNLNYTDKMGMAAGVEVRVPLLDVDLIHFVAHIPPSMKLKGRTVKAIFKKAMEPYLPHRVIYRPKSGFGAPLRYWLRHELKDLVHDTLSDSSLKQRGLFEPSAVQGLIEQNNLGNIDGAYTIFSLICLELWCRIFVDRTVPSFRESLQ